MPEWGIAIIAVVVGFSLNVLYEKYKAKNKTRKESLITHFDEIKSRIIMRLSEMSSNLVISKGRLLFGSLAPVTEHLTFLDNENFLSFEIHFPELAREWNELKSEAMVLKSYVDIVAKSPNAITATEYDDAKKHVNDDLFPLQKKFVDFAKKTIRQGK